MAKSKSDKLFDELETAIEKVLKFSDKEGLSIGILYDLTDLARRAERQRISEEIGNR